MPKKNFKNNNNNNNNKLQSCYTLIEKNKNYVEAMFSQLNEINNCLSVMSFSMQGFEMGLNFFAPQNNNNNDEFFSTAKKIKLPLSAVANFEELYLKFMTLHAKFMTLINISNTNQEIMQEINLITQKLSYIYNTCFDTYNTINEVQSNNQNLLNTILDKKEKCLKEKIMQKQKNESSNDNNNHEQEQSNHEYTQDESLIQTLQHNDQANDGNVMEEGLRLNAIIEQSLIEFADAEADAEANMNEHHSNNNTNNNDPLTEINIPSAVNNDAQYIDI